MKKTLLIILALVIVAALVWYVRFRGNEGASGEGREGTPLADTLVGEQVAAGPWDFNGNGCVGDGADLQALNEKCPAKGGACSVQGETDKVQVALKFAEATKQFPCGE